MTGTRNGTRSVEVLGRRGEARNGERTASSDGRPTVALDRPSAHFGSFRARDGSAGGAVALDLDRPHAGLVVGKRGYGKSYTLGVLAEELARANGVAPVVVDPMGVFATLTATADGPPVTATVVDAPRVHPGVIPPRAWCTLLGLDPASGAGSLVWQAAEAADGLSEMRAHVDAASAGTAAVSRAAHNHIDLANSWDVFDREGLTADRLASGGVTVLDLSGVPPAPMRAVCRGVARSLYDARVDERIERLPWLLVDEAHAFFDGIADPALRTVLTRGRQPGVSFVAATQRPDALPGVAISQSDLLIAHRLTDAADRDALERARPSYVDGSFEDRMPTGPGEVVVVDDTTESVHAVGVRGRDTPHGGESPRASDFSDDHV